MHRHRAGAPAQRRDRAAAGVRRCRHRRLRDYDGWEAGLVDLSRDRVLGNVRQGRGALYKEGVRRDSVLEAVEQLRSRLDQFRMDADADLAALLQRELRGAIERYEELKAAAGALDFLDLLLGARDLVRDNRRCGAASSSASRTSSSTSSRTPIRCRPRSCCCSPPTTRPRPTGARVRPVPGRLFLVGDPKQSIYRFRRADVGIYREVSRAAADAGRAAAAAEHQLPQRPEIQACVNAAFAPVMTGDELTLQAPYVPLAPQPRRAARISRRSSPCRCRRRTRRRYVSGAAIDKSLPAAVGAIVDWIINQSGWKVTERSGDRAGRGRGKARLPALPPLRQLADRRHPALRRGARGARHPARAGRRQGVSRTRGDRGDPRRAGGDRVARRRAVGVRDAARPVLRDRRRGAARLGLPVRPYHRRRASSGTRSILIAFPRSSTGTRRPTSNICGRSPTRCCC